MDLVRYTLKSRIDVCDKQYETASFVAVLFVILESGNKRNLKTIISHVLGMAETPENVLWVVCTINELITNGYAEKYDKANLRDLDDISYENCRVRRTSAGNDRITQIGALVDPKFTYEAVALMYLSRTVTLYRGCERWRYVPCLRYYFHKEGEGDVTWTTDVADVAAHQKRLTRIVDALVDAGYMKKEDGITAVLDKYDEYIGTFDRVVGEL